MPRNGSGVYTLPAGNPVESGTLIEANWANSTLNDLANEITDSLSRSGEGGMLAPFRLADGLQATPGIAWLNEPSTGFYRAGAGEMWGVVGGTQVLQFTGNGLLGRFTSGSVTTPSITRSGDLNTGIYFPGADEIGVATGGVLRLSIDSAGAVNVPGNFSVGGTFAVTGGITFSGNATVGGTLGVTGATTLSSTLAVTGAITASGGVTGNLTGNVTGNVSGNAGTVTNGVYTTGDQTIGGTKTFSATIVGSVSGNAGTVTNGVYTTGSYSDPSWLVSVAGSKVTGNISGNAATATTATNVSGGTVSATTGVFSGNLTLSGGTANGVLYLNGSKVATSGSALTFDGAKFSNVDATDNNQVAALFHKNVTGGANSGVQVHTNGTDAGGGAYALSVSSGNTPASPTNAIIHALVNGNIGIATSSPATRLHVKGSAGGTDPAVVTGERVRIQSNDTTGRSTYMSLIAGTAANSGVLFGDQDAADVGQIRYLHSDNSMQFYTSSAERLRLDSAGNLGLGVTPSAWTSNIKALEGASGGALSFYAAGGFPGTFITSNAYSDGTNWIAKVTDQACLYTLEGTTGKHIWSVAASNTTAGNAITFTQAMTLDSSGNLGIGTASPTHRLTIGSGSYTQAAASSTTGMYTTATGLEMLSDSYYFGNRSGTNLAFLNSSGNLGLGVTPSAWSVFKALQIGTNYGVINFSGIGGAIATNLYFDGTNYKYQTTNAAGLFDFGVTAVGGFAWRIAPSGTAGNNATLTQAMTLDASGNLFVGLTGVPTGWIPTRLTLRAVSSGDSDGLACFGSGSANNITLTHNGTVGVISADYATGGSYTPITFKTSNTERARITAAGNVGIGITNPTAKLDVSGTIQSTATGSAYAGYFNYAGATGQGVGISSVGVGSSYAMFFFNNGVNVGNIYLTSTTTSYNTSSDRRLKSNIVPSPSASNVIDAIEIVSHGWKAAPDKRVTYGLIAQDLAKVAPEAVTVGDDGEEVKETWGVDYSKLVPMLIKEVQSLRKRVAELEAR